MPSLEETSVRYVKGVGPARAEKFANLGVETIEDLIYLFPRRYEDRTKMVSLAQVKVGESQTVTGKVATRASRRSYYTKKHVYEITLDDKTGRLTAVWFNQPYLDHYFKKGVEVILHGKVDQYKNRLQMVSPEYEIIRSEDDQSLSTGRIVPVYPLTKGMSQRYLRKVIRGCLDKYLDQLKDILPVALRNKHHLANLRRSLENIHFPSSFEEQEEALRRITFEEFFVFQVSANLRRLSITQRPGIAHKIKDEDLIAFFQSFPFTLTAAQQHVCQEMAEGMNHPYPMLRLLQGDVGSGKTVVALFGCVMAAKCGYQAALMAPTEILARQHYENIKELVKGFKDQRSKGIEENNSAPQSLNALNPNIVLLTSSMSKKERDAALGQIIQGEADIVIGTHALLSEDVSFKNLSFVVVDEQHKFGVAQRSLISEKGDNPDILAMTATPIPRTLCMTLYGDLDISTLNEMPPGRGTVTTELYSSEQVEEVYEKVRELLEDGKQAYIVYPLVEESDAVDLKAAEQMFKQFKKGEFKKFKVGLVHGQLKRDETKAVMEEFKNREIDILVATTILEVGVDVPSANVMVVEHAERFGLAQLHQLRGRIGRGAEDAVCILVADPNNEEGRQRMEAMMESRDGFIIAERDLNIRGPGQYFGRHQHGISEIQIINPVGQMDVLKLSRKEAIALVESDPGLNKSEHLRVKETIHKRYPGYLSMVEAG